LALSVPLSRFTSRVGGGSAFFVRPHYTFMKITRFKTDRRLWFWIALALFVGSWFIPFMDIKGWHASPFGVFREVAGDVIHGDLPLGNAIAGAFIPLTVLAFVFGVASIIFAWVVQCVVVIIRGKKHEEIDHVA